MSIPKTPVEFDYDLWTTEEGKCMVRIKATGEITEVERSVMQVLRSEEKRLRRTISPEQGPSREGKTAPTVLSLWICFPKMWQTPAGYHRPPND